MGSNVLLMAKEALISLDSESLVSLYSNDFIFEDTSYGEVLTDKEALRVYFDRLFSLPDVGFSDVTFFSCGDRGAGEWIWSGKSLQSGSDFTIRGASIFVLEKNRIKSETLFYDPRPAYR